MLQKVLTSAAIWTVTTLITMALYFVMLIVILFSPSDKSRKKAHAQCFWWARAMVRINPYWEVSVSGLENIDYKKTYVIVANHQSLADIVTLYLLRMQFKWVAKDSLFNVPFVGWCMSLTKHIKLERGEFSSVKKVYREAAVWLKSGMSVLFFPEGTRTETGEMKEFQNGAFKLALRERVPVLPIAITGTFDTIPKGSWLFRTKTRAAIKVLPPIDISVFASANFAGLRDMARNAIESAQKSTA